MSFQQCCVTAGEMHVTIKAYKAEQEDEISLELGETIEVIHKLLDGWWVVRYDLTAKVHYKLIITYKTYPAVVSCCEF